MQVDSMGFTPTVIAQKKILNLIKKSGLNVREIAEIRKMPYTTVRESLNIPGRLTIDHLAWYAEYFGVTADYLLFEKETDKDLKDIGINFRMAREGAELSLENAQQKLGVTSILLDLIEQGKVDASVSLLRNAIVKYGVSPDFLLGAADANENSELINALFKDVRFLLTCQDIYRRSDLKVLFTTLRRLSDDELQKLGQVVDNIIDLFIKA